MVLKNCAIDFIVPQNVWCVAANTPVAVALEKARQEFDIPALAHNHDFYWERTEGLALTCSEAVKLADYYFPPRDPKINHVVINSLAQRELARRKGISSTVIPNIFDFEMAPWKVDDYNRNFRSTIGLNDNDLMILQATRIVPRKGIELAIDFVKELNSSQRRKKLQQCGLYDGRSFNEDSRIVLVLAGYTLDDSTGRYLIKLQEKAEREGVELIHIGDMIGNNRSVLGLKKIYSLWDSYVFADFVTYPSLWEGWGNQFLEAVRARQPIMIFEYPVFITDIKDKGFQVISLGTKLSGKDETGLVQVEPQIIQTAADRAVALLTGPNSRREFVDTNFEIGKKHYSMAALDTYLSPFLQG